VALTVVGELLAVSLDPFTPPAAQEAEVVDEAFRILTILAVPVFAFVVSALAYSVLRFSRRGEPSQDGPPVHTHRPVVAAWLLVTTGLTIFMIVHPGITGMADLAAQADEEVDMVVVVESMRFAWSITYPEQNVTTFRELVLPVGKHVRFDITSRDVLHSFWVPAFRVKIDAVPGLVTKTYATPDRVGSFEDDFNLRLQCAELCGVGHEKMTVPVRVLEQDDFDAWVAQQ
jgi:cytochrome c oxidase subunit 2